MNLWGPHHGGLVRKIEVAALFAGVEVKVNPYHSSKADKAAIQEYTSKINPNGSIPSLETPDGPIWESRAILRYIARLDPSKNLYGKTPYEQALVDQWLDWCAKEYTPVSYAYNAPYFGHGEYDKLTHDAVIEEIKKLIKIPNEHLKKYKFLAGDNITIADIELASVLQRPFQWLWEEKFRKSIPNLTKWYEAVTSEESWKKVYGKPILCKTALTPFVTEKKKKVETGKKKKEETKKEEPKKETKKEEPKKADKAKEEKEEKPEGGKEKNPLDELPPSTFNLFDFKTLFVNAANKHEALDFFWKNFDPQGYSIWSIEYDKAEGEGQVLFLTSNLMNGFLQRLEHFRKYAFGVHGVYGDEPNLEIRGVWVWRGTEIPQEMKEHPSFEYHKFTKLDPNNEADRKKVTEFWTGLNEDEDVVDGLKARTVKYFK